MTNNKDTEDKTTKKLTFSGTRLTLGKSLHPKTLSRVVGSSGSTVVVEVKRGKAVSHGLDIKEGKAENISEDYSQVNRRLSILQKARDDDDKLENTKISTLSRIVEMNQALPIQEDNSVKDTLLASVVSTEKTDVISRPAKPKTIEEEDEHLNNSTSQ
jgi:hypothetical protein